MNTESSSSCDRSVVSFRSHKVQHHPAKAGRISLVAVLLCGLLSLFAVSRTANATNYFSWGAETQSTVIIRGASSPIYGYHGGTTRDCTVAHSGSCSMKLNVIGNDSGNQQMGIDIPQAPYGWNIVGSRAMYYRWYMRIMPGFKWGSGTAKTKSSRIGGGVQGYTGYLMSYGFLIGECSSAGCTLNDGSSNGSDANLKVSLDFRAKADGVWHEYIVKVKPNTSASCTAPSNCDAQFQAWVDGVSVGEYNNFKLHNNASDAMTEFWGGWMVAPYFQLGGTSTDGGTIYLDDFSTDDTWNSVFSGVPPLPAPANLRKQ